MRLGSILFFGVILLLFFSYKPFKAHFFSTHVNCISYDGSTRLYGVGLDKNSKQKQGILEFLNGPYAYLADSVEYTDSKYYRGAEELVSNERGMSLTIMPDKLHGIVEIWKDRKGNETVQVLFPVLCFAGKT